MCPGLGSSSSSTIPNAFGSRDSIGVTGPTEPRMSGDGGGLRDLDRRASSCKKGMGEKSGVGGADAFPGRRSDWKSGILVLLVVTAGGKESTEDVTSRDFSSARRYFPTDL